MNPAELKLRKLARSLDAATLEALANRGLVRRAQKDLERGIQVLIRSATEAWLVVGVGENEVSIPDTGPAMAKCSCPSAGVCHHIVTAILFLQQPMAGLGHDMGPTADEAGSAPVPDPIWMAISADQLEQWAGKPGFKAGLKLARYSNPEIVSERNISVRFRDLNSEVHLIAGAGLDGVIVSGTARGERALTVAAVIAVQRAQGREWAFPEDASALEPAEGAPRTRAEVLESCQRLLKEAADNGLSRMSQANQQRWSTLAVSALGVNLPRLALGLRGLADETTLILTRDARGNTDRLLGQMARFHALGVALHGGGCNPSAGLVGMHRTRYDEVGNLELVGASAWPWRTPSGYEGLTVLFWDPALRHWNSWTDSRPAHQLAGFSAVARYNQFGPWLGAESPHHLVGSAFRLLQARRNSARRLSGTAKSRVVVTGIAKFGEQRVPVLDDWSVLAKDAALQAAIGLREPPPLGTVYAVRPARWGDRSFDPVTQVFTWFLEDLDKRTLSLEIEFNDLHDPAIKYLENVEPDRVSGAIVIGKIRTGLRGLSFYPYTLHSRMGEAIHLHLDFPGASAKIRASVPSEQQEAFEGDEDELEAAGYQSPSLHGMLTEAEDLLLELAEAGLAAPHPRCLAGFEALIHRVRRAGLHVLADGLARLAARPGAFPMLRCHYLCQLHRQAAHVAFGLDQPS